MNVPLLHTGSHQRILFVVNNAAFFVSHRLPLAVEAKARGYDVALCTGQAGSTTLEAPALDALAQAGIQHRRTVFTSAGINPIVELIGLLQVLVFMLATRPHVVHCVSPKGLLYGGIASRLARVPAMVLAVSGMGYAFTAGRASATRRLASWASRTLARLAYGHGMKRVVVQNHDDAAAVLASGMATASEIRLIPGSGVPLERFVSLPIEPRERLVVLPARMLLDKGVAEFAGAARLLRAKGCEWRFALAGTADYANPSTVPSHVLQGWEREGVIEWLGHVDDMPALYGRAAIVCLPSYREGMPKSLLEAAAAGCAVVTTDVTGCREAIIPSVTGDLVPPRNEQALADTLASLINDDARRLRYARAGRQLAIDKFSLDAVVRSTLDIYKELTPHE